MSIKGIASFVLLCAIWGSTWLVIKEGYGGLGPFNSASIRFLMAGAVIAPLVPLLGARWPRGKEWFLVLWVGVMLFASDYGLIYWGEQWLDSGLTAVPGSPDRHDAGRRPGKGLNRPDSLSIGHCSLNIPPGGGCHGCHGSVTGFVTGRQREKARFY